MTRNEWGRVACRKPTRYNGENNTWMVRMRWNRILPTGRRGITVLGLALLILGVVVLAVLLVRYVSV